MECPHISATLKLETPSFVKDKLLKPWTCKECSSSRNPWMCLHCGVVNCGRYVNGHALRHSETHRDHHLCMECENLSVFCYACNDYVVNDTQEGHIGQLRDLFKRMADEKAASEWGAVCGGDLRDRTDPNLCQLRRSLRPRIRKRSHSNDSSSNGSAENILCPQKGKQRRKTNGKGSNNHRKSQKREKRVVGLRNLGNTCFMNAVLQSLSNIEEFCLYFKKMPSLEGIKNRKMYQSTRSIRELKDAIMAEELRKVLINLTDQGTKGAISPESLFLVIWKVVPRYRGYQQQDAHEFLRYMLDRLHTELLHLLPDLSLKESSYMSHKNKTSIVTSVFGGMLQSEVRCLNCGTESKKHDPFLDLSLDIPEKCVNQRKCKETAEEVPPCNILDCLTSFIEVEELAETELYYCSNCKSKQRSTKRFWIRRLPNVLCLHLKRFRWNNFFRTKVDTHVQFPVIALDMSQFVLTDLPDTRSTCSNMYDLAAVIVHHGGGTGCGHYTAFAINDGQWFHFNDSMVRPTETEVVAKCKPYILFYIRREFRLPSVKS